jgi:hypothetical protein
VKSPFELRDEGAERFLRLRHRVILVLGKERREGFRRPGQVLIGDPRLVVGVAAAMVDRAEDCRGVVSVHLKLPCVCVDARLVGRLGMRRIRMGAIAAFTLLSAAMVVLAQTGMLTLVPFMLLRGIVFLVGMVFSNFNALAMERQGHIAETVSPVIGSISTIMTAIIGYVVGQAYDGALVPLSTGYLALAITVIMIIAVTEKGRFLR